MSPASAPVDYALKRRSAGHSGGQTFLASFFQKSRHLFLALLACQACTPEAPKADIQACTKEKLVDLPMAHGLPQPMVAAKLDEQAVLMMIDTGREGMSLRRSAAMALRLPEDPGHSTTTQGFGGTATNHDVLIQHFELGGVELLQSRAAVIEQIGVPRRAQQPAGIIGGLVLAYYDVELDFIRRHVVLWQVSGCDHPAPAWEGNWASARLVRGPRDLITLDVSVDGKPVRALLTTGLPNSMIDIDTADALRISSASLSAAHEVVMRGADGNDVVAHVVPVRDVAVGTLHRVNFDLVASPIHLHNANMLLGADFLQHRDVWISYAGQQLFIR